MTPEEQLAEIEREQRENQRRLAEARQALRQLQADTEEYNRTLRNIREQEERARLLAEQVDRLPLPLAIDEAKKTTDRLNLLLGLAVLAGGVLVYYQYSQRKERSS